MTSEHKNEFLHSLKMFAGVVIFVFLIAIVPQLLKTPKPWLTLQSPKDTGNAEKTYELEVKIRDTDEITVAGTPITCEKQVCTTEIQLEKTVTDVTVVAKNKKHETKKTYTIRRDRTEEETEIIKAQLAEEEKQKKIEEENKVIDQLKREIKSIDEGLDFTTYKEDILGIELGGALFGTWALIIEEAEEKENTEIQTLVQELKTKVSRVQAREFPELRKAYALIARDTLWSENIDVKIHGGSYDTIEFIGYSFVDNKSIDLVQDTIYDIVKLLRFEQVRYRTSKYADEYTYFNLNTSNDSTVETIK